METRREPVGVEIALVAVVALVAVAYVPAIDAPFVFDDLDIVRHDGMHHVLPADWLPISRRPVALLSFALSWVTGGGAPAAFRGANIAIHVASTLLVARVARLALGAPRVALPDRAARAAAVIAAALWALHPLHTSSVTYVIHRYESLAGLFYFASLAACLAAMAGIRPRTSSLAACAWLALAGLSKESAVTLPAVALAVDATLFERGFVAALSRRWPLYLSLAASLAPLAYMLLTRAAVPSQSTAFSGVTPLAYLLSEPAALAWYARLTVVPWPLAIDYYDWPVVSRVADCTPAAWTVVALSVAAAVGLARRRLAWLAPALVLVALSPTSSIVPLSHELVAERRMYVPLAAVAIAIAGAGARLAVARPRAAPFLMASAAVVSLALAGTTAARNVVYLDPIALHRSDVERRPGNARAHEWLASALADAGRVEEAAAEHRTAVDLDPRLPGAERLGALLADATGDLPRAVALARVAAANAVGDAPATMACARILARGGADDDALAVLARAPRNVPSAATFDELEAWVLATSATRRDGPRALAIAERLLARAGDAAPPRWRETHAAALAAAGRTADAARAVEALLALARAAGSEAAVRRLDAERTAYLAGAPWTRRVGDE